MRQRRNLESGRVAFAKGAICDRASIRDGRSSRNLKRDRAPLGMYARASPSSWVASTEQAQGPARPRI